MIYYPAVTITYVLVTKQFLQHLSNLISKLVIFKVHIGHYTHTYVHNDLLEDNFDTFFIILIRFILTFIIHISDDCNSSIKTLFI